ncbi:MAG: hypothetical protein QXZ61_01640 [Saccharolobus sp.]
MNRKCYYNYGYRKCTTICGRLICEESIVNEYIILCKLCNAGYKKQCLELYEKFNCDTVR